MSQLELLFGETISSKSADFAGIVFIGDPHVESRQPGFRKDNYGQTILTKMRWIWEYCQQGHYLPVLLGDLFERPRDNPNWLISALLDLFNTQPSYAIFGNHDCSEPQLSDDDSLSLLLKGSKLKLLGGGPESHFPTLMVSISGQQVVLGGSSYRQPLPEDFLRPASASHVIWISHHDMADDASSQRFGQRRQELAGVDVVINGHIHRRAEPEICGQTQWLTPGNISRRSRNELIATHRPAVLRLQIQNDERIFDYVEVPHQSADEVFHPADELADATEQQSNFVWGLSQLQALKTQSGAGLAEFLAENAEQFAPDVNAYILELMGEVIENAAT